PWSFSRHHLVRDFSLYDVNQPAVVVLADLDERFARRLPEEFSAEMEPIAGNRIVAAMAFETARLENGDDITAKVDLGRRLRPRSIANQKERDWPWVVHWFPRNAAAQGCTSTLTPATIGWPSRINVARTITGMLNG